MIEGALILDGVDHSGYNEVLALNQTETDISEFAGDYWIEHIGLEAAWGIEDSLSLLSSVTIGVVDTGVPADQNIIDESRLTRLDRNGVNIDDDDSFGEPDYDLPSNQRRLNHGLWTTAFAAGFYDESRTTPIDDISRGVSRNSNVIHVDIYERQCEAVLNCLFGGEAFTTDVLAGIMTAIRRGADVINISWGDTSKCSHSTADRIASRQATRKGWSSAIEVAKSEDSLLVFSSGNNCEKQDNQLLPSVDDIEADAWLTNALIVGATDENRSDALFSRMGNVVNLVAPGQNVGYGVDDLGWWDDDDTTNGTSFSAPMVAGVAAIAKGISGTLSAPEIRHILINSAEPTVTFADAMAASHRGYVGENATGPNRMLSAGNAAKTSLLTRGVELDSVPNVTLLKGENTDVSFSVRLPETAVNSLDAVFLIDTSGKKIPHGDVACRHPSGRFYRCTSK